MGVALLVFVAGVLFNSGWRATAKATYGRLKSEFPMLDDAHTRLPRLGIITLFPVAVLVRSIVQFPDMKPPQD